MVTNAEGYQCTHVDDAARQQLRGIITQLVAKRRSDDITQNDLADRLGVVTASLAGWEAGRIRPTMDHSILWAAELGFRFSIDTPQCAGVLPTLDVKEGELLDHEMKRLAGILRSARRALVPRVSQNALADVIGVSRITVSNWENGKFPHTVFFLVWAASLKCTVTLRQQEGVAMFGSKRRARERSGESVERAMDSRLLYFEQLLLGVEHFIAGREGDWPAVAAVTRQAGRLEGALSCYRRLAAGAESSSFPALLEAAGWEASRLVEVMAPFEEEDDE